MQQVYVTEEIDKIITAQNQKIDELEKRIAALELPLSPEVKNSLLIIGKWLESLASPPPG